MTVAGVNPTKVSALSGNLKINPRHKGDNIMPKITFDRDLVEKTKLHDIMPLLAARHPQLTTEQHQKRRGTATHECAHLIAALAVEGGHPGPSAFIRVPGRSSKRIGGARGMDGVVDCGAYTSRAEAFIYAAGGIAEVIMGLPDAETAIEYDDIMFARHLKGCIVDERLDPGAEPETARTICDECLTAIVTHWDLVEKAAVAVLLHTDTNGDLRGRAWGDLIEYLQWKLQRDRWVAHPYYTPPRAVRIRAEQIATQ